MNTTVDVPKWVRRLDTPLDPDTVVANWDEWGRDARIAAYHALLDTGACTEQYAAVTATYFARYECGRPRGNAANAIMGAARSLEKVLARIPSDRVVLSTPELLHEEILDDIDGKA